jgi:hypothetical protein
MMECAPKTILPRRTRHSEQIRISLSQSGG